MEDTRADKGLAFMLQYENVAWYDAGTVKILDRRVYPRNVEFVTCRTHVEVMQAIRDMVTQSAGPYTAAGMGMALAAWECRKSRKKSSLRFFSRRQRALQTPARRPKSAWSRSVPAASRRQSRR